MDIDNREQEFLAGLIVGAVLGAGAVIVLGTKEGKEIRSKLIRKGREILEELPQLSRTTRKKLKEPKN